MERKGATTPSITTLKQNDSIMTLSKLKISGGHNIKPSIVHASCVVQSNVYAEGTYSTATFTLSVVMLNVVTLSVVAPEKEWLRPRRNQDKRVINEILGDKEQR